MLFSEKDQRRRSNRLASRGAWFLAYVAVGALAFLGLVFLTGEAVDRQVVTLAVTSGVSIALIVDIIRERQRRRRRGAP